MRTIRRERMTFIKYGGLHEACDTCNKEPEAYLEIYRLRITRFMWLVSLYKLTLFLGWNHNFGYMDCSHKITEIVINKRTAHKSKENPAWCLFPPDLGKSPRKADNRLDCLGSNLSPHTSVPFPPLLVTWINEVIWCLSVPWFSKMGFIINQPHWVVLRFKSVNFMQILRTVFWHVGWALNTYKIKCLSCYFNVNDYIYIKH